MKTKFGHLTNFKKAANNFIENFIAVKENISFGYALNGAYIFQIIPVIIEF
jgi:hypothetical protein